MKVRENLELVDVRPGRKSGDFSLRNLISLRRGNPFCGARRVVAAHSREEKVWTVSRIIRAPGCRGPVRENPDISKRVNHSQISSPWCMAIFNYFQIRAFIFCCCCCCCWLASCVWVRARVKNNKKQTTNTTKTERRSNTPRPTTSTTTAVRSKNIFFHRCVCRPPLGGEGTRKIV